MKSVPLVWNPVLMWCKPDFSERIWNACIASDDELCCFLWVWTLFSAFKCCLVRRLKSGHYCWLFNLTAETGPIGFSSCSFRSSYLFTVVFCCSVLAQGNNVYAQSYSNFSHYIPNISVCINICLGCIHIYKYKGSFELNKYSLYLWSQTSDLGMMSNFTVF